MSAPNPTSDVRSENENSESIIDWKSAMEVVDGDRELLIEIAASAVQELQRLMGQLDESVKHRDAPSVRIAAHSVQGTLRVFQNVEATELVQALEMAARENCLDGVDTTYKRLNSLLEQILSELIQLESKG